MKKYYYGLIKKEFNNFCTHGIIDFQCENLLSFAQSDSFISKIQLEHIEKTFRDLSKNYQDKFEKIWKNCVKVCIFPQDELANLVKTNDFKAILEFSSQNICDIFREQNLLKDYKLSFIEVSCTKLEMNKGIILSYILEHNNNIVLIKIDYSIELLKIDIDTLFSYYDLTIEKFLNPLMIKNIILTNYSKARMYKIIESLNKNYKKLLEQSNEQEKQDYILDWSVIMQKFMSLDTALRCLDIEDLEEIVKKNKV